MIRELGGIPPPPADLQVRVVGTFAADFLDSGHEVLDAMNRVLERYGAPLSSHRRVLDLGCGCGRVLRALSLRTDRETTELFGADIDAEAVRWCQENYSHQASFSVVGASPPTAFPSGFFDLIYAISVFTHLPEELQFSWLAEIRRILKPGGYALLTVHGAAHVHSVPRERKDELTGRGFVYAKTGATRGLPAFYQTAWHSATYVRQQWGSYFQVVDVVEGAVGNRQDIVVCRRPETTEC
jgi:SAM-dependent methyltransferase